jgi:thiopeptide-type bacteriocin biosynthesis protein
MGFDDWDVAERIAVTDLGPLLSDAESTGAISSWFFLRKAPHWRVRFHPSSHDTQTATRLIHSRLDALAQAGRVTRWIQTIYEPETHAFGGPAAMDLAHSLFHRDSRHILRRLGDAANPPGHRNELAILWVALLLRSAGLDWHEQGDVWAQVATHRPLPPQTPPDRLGALQPALHRLLTVDTATLLHGTGPLTSLADWASAFTDTGAALRDLADTGALCRGLRAILAKHVLFAWNRIGLPYATQSLFAHTATVVIFGE